MRFAVWAVPFLGLVALFLLAAGRGAPAEGKVGLAVHYDRPVGECASPGPDGGQYGLTGLRLPAEGVTYYTNRKFIPKNLSATDVQAAIDASFAIWDDTTGAELFTTGGPTTARVGFADGINTVGFQKGASGAVGVTYVWIDKTTNVITEFDIALSTNFEWGTNGGASGDCGGASGAFDVRNIMTHEAGHALGLNDLYGEVKDAQTMYGYAAYAELFKRDLAGGDVAGLSALYGP